MSERCAGCGRPLDQGQLLCGDCERTRSADTTDLLYSDPAVPLEVRDEAEFPPLEGYRCAGVLGRGGMGAVYLADDTILHRTVAIKVISAERRSASQDRTRFLREARSMAAIEHPNVVRVYSFGEVQGRPYLVMEYVAGESLAARLRRGPLPAKEACRIVREIAAGLNAAWARRLVHRDVKPSNVLLDSRGKVRVADFGLAESFDPAEEEGVRGLGAVGTAQYVAPEQARGQAVDFRADVYSLGVVFYELLAGRPFERGSPTDAPETPIEKQLSAVRRSRRDVPEAIARLVAWMTRADPAARPDSYRALIEALDAAAPPEPAVLSVPSWWPVAEVWRSLRRGRGRGLAAAWVITNLVCALSGVLNVVWAWNAIPVALGPLRFDVTVYPAFPLSLLWAVWLGPGWGVLPLYLANLLGAAYGGVPFPVNVLFAAAGPIELLILWCLFVALDIGPDLRTAREGARFVTSAAVAAVIASTGVIAWNASLGNDFATGQRLWYGWVVGDILQAALLAAPCMRLVGGRVRAWAQRELGSSPRTEVTQARVTITLAVVLAALGILVFVGFGMVQDSLERDLTTLTGRTELRLRLFEMHLFLGILVLALVVATGLVSTTLARRGVVELRRKEDL